MRFRVNQRPRVEDERATLRTRVRHRQIPRAQLHAVQFHNVQIKRPGRPFTGPLPAVRDLQLLQPPQQHGRNQRCPPKHNRVVIVILRQSPRLQHGRRSDKRRNSRDLKLAARHQVRDSITQRLHYVPTVRPKRNHHGVNVLPCRAPPAVRLMRAHTATPRPPPRRNRHTTRWIRLNRQLRL